ncbi:MAG: polysaccharide deacetylase family protein [bacterium]
MKAIFNNGATRARMAAWAWWVLFLFAMTGVYLFVNAPPWWGRLCLLTAFGLGSGLILVRLRPRKIPVLNYHSVSADPEWLQIGDRVSLTPSAFERQLAYLARQGYQSLFVSEVHALLAGCHNPESQVKHVALTFDDGYADNWIAAFPLLRKYGIKATMFVSTGFITGADGCRPTIGDVAPDALDWSGYLTWPELRAMQASGLVEVQSHGGTHTRVFTGSEVQGFVGPGKPNLWLLLNNRPDIRPGWWSKLGDDRSLWGHPVFRQAPSLAHRAYQPDKEAVENLMSWAGGAGGAVFAGADWEQRLFEEWRRERHVHGDRGHRESREEYERRVEEELGESRRILERELGVMVYVLCWPENRFSEEGEQIACGMGYLATVSNRHKSRNVAGESPESIVRVFIGGRAAGVRSPFLDYLAFILELKVFEGWYNWYPVLAVMHLARKVVFAARRLCSCRRDYFSIWS